MAPHVLGGTRAGRLEWPSRSERGTIERMSSPHGRVAQAMEAVPRADYLPRGQRRHAAADEPLPLGDGSTCSQPSTVARMLSMLDPHPDQRVLDVGAGSGWTTALLANLVEPRGRVFGVEIIPRLVRSANKRLAASGVTNGEVHRATEGQLGLPQFAPFDRILVSAMTAKLPQDLVDQLADGGRMVIPVDGRMTTVRRTGTAIAEHSEGHYRFVPLQ